MTVFKSGECGSVDISGGTNCIEDSGYGDHCDGVAGEGDARVDDVANRTGNVGGDGNRRSWWQKLYYLTLNQVP